MHRLRSAFSSVGLPVKGMLQKLQNATDACWGSAQQQKVDDD